MAIFSEVRISHKRVFIQILAFIIILFPSVAYVNGLNNVNEGFNGFPWGTLFNEMKDQLKIVKYDYRNEFFLQPELKFYFSKIGADSIPGVTLLKIQYIFNNDRFCGVRLHYKNNRHEQKKIERIIKEHVKSMGGIPSDKEETHFNTKVIDVHLFDTFADILLLSLAPPSGAY